MKVYTADEHADQIERVWFCGLDVTNKAPKVALWLGFAKWNWELGLGYVDVYSLLGPIRSLKTRRLYGPILIKFKGVSNENRAHSSTQLD